MSQPDEFPTANHPEAQGINRRRVMRPLALAVPVALLSLLTACGDSGTAAGGSTSQPPVTSQSPSGGAAGSELTAVVGEEGNVDAFTITLTDSTGAPVTSLKAGDYTVKVKDLSKIHNFHLTGTGVEEKTSVPEVAEATWTVKLEAGTYTFICDPHHKKMVGTFTVT